MLTESDVYYLARAISITTPQSLLRATCATLPIELNARIHPTGDGGKHPHRRRLDRFDRRRVNMNVRRIVPFVLEGIVGWGSGRPLSMILV